jgi:hypothetical protein
LQQRAVRRKRASIITTSVVNSYMLAKDGEIMLVPSSLTTPRASSNP